MLKRYFLILQGTILDTSLASGEYNCAVHCQLENQCQWYSYNAGLGICQHFQTCSNIDQNSEFQSSKIQCFTGESQKQISWFQYLLVIIVKLNTGSFCCFCKLIWAKYSWLKSDEFTIWQQNDNQHHSYVSLEQSIYK